MSEIRTKICKVCKQEKLLHLFYFRKDNQKYREACIECHAATAKKYRESNCDTIKISKVKYYVENKETIDRKNKINYDNNKQKYIEAARRYRSLRSDWYIEYKSEWAKQNRTRINIKRKILRDSKWEEMRRKDRLYEKQKLTNDPTYKIHKLISHRIRQSLKTSGATKKPKYFVHLSITS